jgi:hypothetical protein
VKFYECLGIPMDHPCVETSLGYMCFKFTMVCHIGPYHRGDPMYISVGRPKISQVICQ